MKIDEYVPVNMPTNNAMANSCRLLAPSISEPTTSNDTTGNADDNSLWGNSGDNRMFGGDGADYLAGGAGNDMLNGGQGNNQLDGGTGLDVAFYDGDFLAPVN